MAKMRKIRVRQGPDTPFLVQLVAWANVATGLLLLTRYAYFSSSKGGHLYVAVVALVELAVGIPLAFGARWAYYATLVLQPLNLAASIVLWIATKDPAPLLPVAFYALTSFLLLVRPGMDPDGAIRTWARSKSKPTRSVAVTTGEPTQEHAAAA
jgi:hypothetical protein